MSERRMTQEERGEIEQWLDLRRKAAVAIDPDTCEVTWWYALTMDPYGVWRDDDGQDNIERGYFARGPDCDLWVSFYDLPDATRKALWQKHRNTSAFPAGSFETLSVVKELIPPLDPKKDPFLFKFIGLDNSKT
jgi:hypothetical protein